MPSGGNEIKFDFDPTAMGEQESLYAVVEPVAEKPANPPATQQPKETIEPKEEEKVEVQNQNNESKPNEESQQKTVQHQQEQKPAEEQKPDNEVSEAQIINAYNKKHGTSYKSLDDLKEIKEVEKVVEKEAELPQDVQQYIRFKEENPDKGFADWTELNKDYSKLSNMDLAREAIQAENAGLSLTPNEVDILLAEKMKVDLDDLGSLEGAEMVRLKSFANRHLQTKLQEQKKYKQPKEPKPKEKGKSQPVGETVTLTNGQVVSKAAYEESRRNYINARQKAVDGLEKFEVSLEIDHNGEKKQLPFKYDYKPDDKHSMLSATEDVSTILPRYQTAEGFNHSSFNEDMWWANKANREKAIKAMLVDARSKGVDEVIQQKRNINFDNKPAPHQKPKDKEGYANGKILEVGRTGSYGVKYNLPSD